MNDTAPPPSGWRIEKAMAALAGARARLLADDPSIADDSKLLLDMIEGELDTGDYVEVIRRIFRCAIEAEDMADDLDRRIERLKVRRDRFRRNHNYLRTAARGAMEMLGLDRVGAPDFSATIAAAGRDAVVITDEKQLPEAYCKIERTPRKREITAALKAGLTVTGAELANGMPVLTIRKA
jgi:hypothetical protein